MSKQNLLDFGDRVMENQTLHNRLKALPPNDAEGLIAIAEEVGYSFTADELMEVIEDVKAKMDKSQELSEAELDGVAGGAVDAFRPVAPMTFLAKYFVMTPGTTTGF